MLNEKNNRILVIDDNQTIHEDFRKILASGGGTEAAELDAAEAALFGAASKDSSRPNFHVDSAMQGQDGLKLVEKAVAEGRRYAMAFVDVRMPPGWDGIETASHIWKCDPDLQIVICTAYSEYSWDRMLEKLGQTDRLLILKKPFDNIEVLQLANALTEKWQLVQQTKNTVLDLENKVRERTSEIQATNTKLAAEIQERKQAEAALRNSQETVVRQERLAVVGQLSAGLAHEFNNILTIIQGHTNLLVANSTIDDDAIKSLSEIQSGTERAANLTRQMLAFSRKQVIQRQPLDINELLSQARKLLLSALREDIQVSFQTEAKLKIHADAGMIEQILLNLAINARDAMPRGGKLVIRTHDVEVTTGQIAALPPTSTSEAYAGQFVCLTVSDTGCGMEPSTLQRIFEPFFTTKDVGKGTGLGLSTVYGIVKQHDGWIEVTSETGQGTAFKIFFPPPKPIAETDPKAKIVSIGGTGKTVLVVEDEAPLRSLIRSVLRNQGFVVYEASNGTEALEIWRAHAQEICLLLTDMVMPEGMSGSELAQKLLVDRPELSVIYTSGYSEEVYGRDILSNGTNFLPKPYHPGQLIQMIYRCLGGSTNTSTSVCG